MSRNRIHPRALVTGSGGPAGIAVMKAIAGDFNVYAADIDPFAAGLYLVPEGRRMILPRGDDPGFVDALLAYCRREEIDVLIPTVDSELLPVAMHRDTFSAEETELVLASEQTLRLCLDKWTLHQHCAGYVPLPQTVLADEAFEPADIPLPAVVKPRVGSGSRGVRLVETRAELEELPRDGTLIVQEHLPGIEHSLDTLATPGGEVIAVVPRARLKVDSGIAVTSRTVRNLGLQTIGRAVAERIGLTSVANIQVKETAEGDPVLIEVNPRFPGTMSLTVEAGVNMPRLCANAAIGTPLPTETRFREIGMVRHFEETFFPLGEIERMEDLSRSVHD